MSQGSLLPDYNLKALDGIFAFAIFNGLWLAVLIYTGIDASETGFLLAILDALAGLLGDSAWIIGFIGIAITILDIYIVYRSIQTIYQSGSWAIFAAATGFMGSLLLFIGGLSGTPGIPVVGVIILFVGAIGIRFAQV